MNTKESDFVNRDGFEQEMKWVFHGRNGEIESWIDSKNVEVSCRQPTQVNQDNNPQSQKTPRPMEL